MAPDTSPPPRHQPSTVSITYPAVFRIADRASIAGQRAYRRLLAIELVMVVTGAASGILVGRLAASPLLAGVAAAVTFMVAIAARVVRERRQDDRRWFDGRAVAESAKTQAWRYMMRVPPFEDDRSADRRFTMSLASILHERGRFAEPDDELSIVGAQITDAMRSLRSMATQDRRDQYVAMRLLEQAEWYRLTGRRHKRAGERWSTLSIVCEGAAIVVAIATVLAPWFGELGLLGTFGAGAAACTAWMQVGRHEESAIAYSLAQQEILLICSLAMQATTDDELAEIVRDGEGAISREHTMWVAKRSAVTAPDAIDRLAAGPSMEGP